MTDMNASKGTVSAWINPAGFSDSGQYIFGHTSEPAYGSRVQIYTDDVNGNLDLGLGSEHALRTDIYTLQTGVWQQVILTWDSGSYALYVNGVSQANGTYTGLTELNSIADFGNTGNINERIEGFNGILDDARIFNYALSSIEVLDLYNTTKPDENSTPVISSIENQEVFEGELIQFDIIVSDANTNDTITLSASNLPQGATITPNGNRSWVFTWQTNFTSNDNSPYTISLIANDGESDSDPVNVEITVNDVSTNVSLSNKPDWFKE